jgi:hypothetical protein
LCGGRQNNDFLPGQLCSIPCTRPIRARPSSDLTALNRHDGQCNGAHFLVRACWVGSLGKPRHATPGHQGRDSRASNDAECRVGVVIHNNTTMDGRHGVGPGRRAATDTCGGTMLGGLGWLNKCVVLSEESPRRDATRAVHTEASRKMCGGAETRGPVCETPPTRLLACGQGRPVRPPSPVLGVAQ